MTTASRPLRTPAPILSAPCRPDLRVEKIQQADGVIIVQDAGEGRSDTAKSQFAFTARRQSRVALVVRVVFAFGESRRAVLVDVGGSFETRKAAGAHSGVDRELLESEDLDSTPG